MISFASPTRAYQRIEEERASTEKAIEERVQAERLQSGQQGHVKNERRRWGATICREGAAHPQ